MATASQLSISKGLSLTVSIGLPVSDQWVFHFRQKPTNNLRSSSHMYIKHHADEGFKGIHALLKASSRYSDCFSAMHHVQGGVVRNTLEFPVPTPPHPTDAIQAEDTGRLEPRMTQPEPTPSSTSSAPNDAHDEWAPVDLFNSLAVDVRGTVGGVTWEVTCWNWESVDVRRDINKRLLGFKRKGMDPAQALESLRGTKCYFKDMVATITARPKGSAIRGNKEGEHGNFNIFHPGFHFSSHISHLLPIPMYIIRDR